MNTKIVTKRLAMIRMGLILGFIMSLALIFAAYTETQGASVAEAQASAAPTQGCVTFPTGILEISSRPPELRR